jgi:predicted cupin superfamily sugar epimerase
MSEELTRSGGYNSDRVRMAVSYMSEKANQIRGTQALVSSDYYLLTSHSHQEFHHRISQKTYHTGETSIIQARLWFNVLPISKQLESQARA